MTYEWSPVGTPSISDQFNFAVSGHGCNFDVMLHNNLDEQNDPDAWAEYVGYFRDALEDAGFTVSNIAAGQTQPVELVDVP